MSKDESLTMDSVKKLADELNVCPELLLTTIIAKNAKPDILEKLKAIVDKDLIDMKKAGCDLLYDSYMLIKYSLGWETVLFLELISEAILVDIDFKDESAEEKDDRESLNLFLFNGLTFSLGHAIERIKKERNNYKETIKSLTKALNQKDQEDGE